MRALEQVGFKIKRQQGSHIIMRRSEPFAQLVVPDHKQLDRGTLRAIIRQANLTDRSIDEQLGKVSKLLNAVRHSIYYLFSGRHPADSDLRFARVS